MFPLIKCRAKKNRIKKKSIRAQSCGREKEEIKKDRKEESH